MNAARLRTKIIQEVESFPESKLTELYDLIHFFRIGLETIHLSTSIDIMQFAGCWQDMSDIEFHDFLAEITERRQHAFPKDYDSGIRCGCTYPANSFYY